MKHSSSNLRTLGMFHFVFSVLPLSALCAVSVTAKTVEEARKELGQLGLPYSRDAFLSAVREGDRIGVEVFLDAGMDVNVQSREGTTALMLASASGKTNMVAFLLKREASPKLADRDGATALMYAARKSDWTIVKLLIDAGADIKGVLDVELFLNAVRENDRIGVEVFLDAGMDVNVQGRDGSTALMLASASGKTNMVALLLKREASTKLADASGVTALMYAVREGHWPIAKLLIDVGADANAKDSAGNTVVDIALFANPSANIDLLLNAGARARRFVTHQIEEAASALKQKASNAARSQKDALLDATKEYALHALRDFDENKLFDSESRNLARTNFVVALEEALPPAIVSFSTTNTTESSREITLKFANLAEQILPGSKERVMSRANKAAEEAAKSARNYDTAFVEAFRSRWYDLLENMSDEGQRRGRVVLQFRLNYDGRITEMKVIENKVTEVFALLCQKAVLDPSPFDRWTRQKRLSVGADFETITLAFSYGKERTLTISPTR